jgi:hypothetical protein
MVKMPVIPAMGECRRRSMARTQDPVPQIPNEKGLVYGSSGGQGPGFSRKYCQKKERKKD